MTGHNTALVPLATSIYQSPELHKNNIVADTGLFAESLIYYESALVQTGTPQQFASFISRLIQQGLSYNQLIDLIDEGALRFFNTITIHPFVSRNLLTDAPMASVIKNLVPIQESSEKLRLLFETQYLNTDDLRNSFSDLSNFNEHDYDRFCRSAKNASLVVDGEEIDAGLIDAAYDDILNSTNYKALVESLLSGLYEIQNLGKIPDFEIAIEEISSKDLDKAARDLEATIIGRGFTSGEYKFYKISCQIPFGDLQDVDNLRRSFRTLPISLAGISNLYVRLAGKLKSDFFLPSPLSRIIGDKLFNLNDLEISKEFQKNQLIIDSLEQNVRFPDLRKLVNTNKVDFAKVIEVRKKGRRFRRWLQTTDIAYDKDWEVFYAYHNEVANETGFTKGLRHSLRIFGFVSSAAIGGIVGQTLSDDAAGGWVGGTGGVVANELVKQASRKVSEKLFDYGATIGQDWKPICFGNWYKRKVGD